MDDHLSFGQRLLKGLFPNEDFGTKGLKLAELRIEAGYVHFLFRLEAVRQDITIKIFPAGKTKGYLETKHLTVAIDSPNQRLGKLYPLIVNKVVRRLETLPDKDLARLFEASNSVADETVSYRSLELFAQNAMDCHGSETVIHFFGQCNQNCRFCHGHGRNVDIAGEPLTHHHYLELLRGEPNLLLSNHEPSVFPGILDVISRARELKTREVKMETNGLVFADETVCQEFAKAGLTQTRVTFLAARADIHDDLTQVPGSFEKLLAALENMKRFGIREEITFLALDSNVDEFQPFMDMLRSIKRTLKYLRHYYDNSPPPLTQEKTRLFLEHVPDFTRLKSRILNKLPSNVALLTDRTGYLPLCVWGKLLSDFPEVKDGYRQRKSENLCTYKTCSLFSVCRGPHPLYVRKFGFEGLVPIS